MERKDMKIRVYIASAYTIGDTAVNVRKQIDVGNELIGYGFAVFLPLLSHFQHMIHPQPYEVWMDQDMTWVASCDCLLRLPGQSRGADREVDRAKEVGIPVFFSVDELCKYYNITHWPDHVSY